MSGSAAGSRALREHVGISRSTQTLPVRVTGAGTFTLLECADDEDALLLLEGMTFAELSAVAAETPCEDVRLEDLSRTHAVLAADGPYAFELLADAVTADVLGLPYGSFFAIPGGYCFRAGKTGEYGYLLLLEHAAAERVWQALHAGLPRFEGAELSLADLDLAALENGFFSLRHAPGAALGPSSAGNDSMETW